MSTSNTITLERGETLNMDLIPETDGVDVPLDDTWQCLCFIKTKCGTLIDLAPVLTGTIFVVTFDTATLAASSYTGDVVFIDSSGNRSVSKEFNLFLSGTISPIT